MLFSRICPECATELFYTLKGNRDRLNKQKSLCKSCAHRGDRNHRTGMPSWNKGKKGIYSKEYLQKLSDSHKGQISSFKGKTHSKESKEKLRVARCKWIEKIGGGPQYNPTACKYFDILNERKGWNLQHAMNGGEITVCGYYLDAYDKARNIVVEYDEPAHEVSTKKKKDLIRQSEIIESISPKEFWRYNERHNELRRVI